MTAIAIEPNSHKWFEEKKRHIDASDAPVILGLVKNWCVLSGTEHERFGENSECEERKHLSCRVSLLEELVKSIYTHETGNEVFAASMYEHPEYKWMSAVPGGWIEADDGEYIFEYKIEVTNACCKLFEVSREEIMPESYWVQLQHKMEVACADRAIVANLLIENSIINEFVQLLDSGTELESVTNLCLNLEGIKFGIIEVDKDIKFIKKLVCAERRFWDDVQRGVLI